MVRGIFYFTEPNLQKMFLRPFEINRKSLVSDIVSQDYRTADVFRQHGIGYCCGGKWPMDMACEMRGIDAEKLQAELEAACRTLQISTRLDFTNWDIEFLLDYIIHVHHRYLKATLKETEQVLHEFTLEHIKKYPYLSELENKFSLLTKQLMSSVEQEEEVIFPYIRQLTHAHKHKESYAALFIRTLRKPVEAAMFKGHEVIVNIILSVRKLTNAYTSPENACINHKVVLAKLKELDNDLTQHLYLEQSILFPRAIAIEKELLSV